jgi:integrase
MNIPSEPLKKTFKNQAAKGYVYYKTADGKRRQKYFKGEYKSREMWDDFTAWTIKQAGGQLATRTPAMESLRQPGDARRAGTVYEVIANRISEVKISRCKGTKADQAEITLVKRSLLLLAPYDEMLADDINGTHLTEIQQGLINSQANSRKTINTKMKIICGAFEYGHINGLCLAATSDLIMKWRQKHSLKGKDTHVRGPKDVSAADENLVRETIAAANPLLGTMITCQLHTGMRSENLTELRWQDIDRSMYETEGVWLYSPTHHKTETKGKELPIYFGPAAITRLLDYEKMRPDQGHPYIFNPKASWCYPQFATQKTTTRRPTGAAAKILKLLQAGPASTTRLQGIKRHFNSKITYLRNLGHDIERTANPNHHKPSVFTYHGYTKPESETKSWSHFYERSKKTSLNAHYSTDTYYKAVAKLLKKSGLPHWHPHQLRHLHATKVGHSLGIEAAQAVVGHSNQRTTRRYMEKNKALARKSQKVFG